MSFKSYALCPAPDDTWVIEDPQPLILSGRHGLIARFVQSNPVRASQPWALCPGELHALAFPERLVRDRAILFEQVSGAGREFQWLRGIQGISGRRTEMTFGFMPVTVVRAVVPYRIRPLGSLTYNETLELTGGVLAPDGCWQWGRPHLGIGSVVLNPGSVSHYGGSRERGAVAGRM